MQCVTYVVNLNEFIVSVWNYLFWLFFIIKESLFHSWNNHCSLAWIKPNRFYFLWINLFSKIKSISFLLSNIISLCLLGQLCDIDVRSTFNIDDVFCFRSTIFAGTWLLGLKNGIFFKLNELIEKTMISKRYKSCASA